LERGVRSEPNLNRAKSTSFVALDWTAPSSASVDSISHIALRNL